MQQNRTTWTVVFAVAAFAAGLGAARFSTPAYAADNMKVQIINLLDMKPDDISKPSATDSRSRTLATADGATFGIQIGATARHYHAEANELQYVVEGTGSEWLGEKIVQLRPGDLLIIPKGTPHGGLTPGVKVFNMKTPPQKAGDSIPVK